MFRKAVLVVLLLLLIVYYTIASKNMDVEVMVILLGVVAFSTFLFFTKKEPIVELKGQFFKHTNFVIIGLLIVNFQLYIDFILGNISQNNTFIWVNQSIVVKSLTLSTIGLLSFFLGTFFYKKKTTNMSFKNKIKESTPSVKILLYTATLVLGIYFYTVNPLYLLGFYGSEVMGTTATYMVLLFHLLIFSIIIQSTRNLKAKNIIPKNFINYTQLMGNHLTIILGIYLLSVVVSGDRGPLMIYGLCYISGYFFIKRAKLSYKKGILIVISGAMFISLLGVVRRLDKGLSFTEKIQQSLNNKSTFSNASFLPPTLELAGSVKTVHHALDYVPTYHDFFYGRFQFQQLTVAIPFSNIFNQLIFNDTSKKYNGSAPFITWIFQGNHPNYGNGTSCIADFYLDFGLFGVIIGMFLFGYFMRLAEVNMYAKTMPTLFTHIFIIIYLSVAIYIARSSVLFEFRNLVWIFIILIFNKYIINKKIKDI